MRCIAFEDVEFAHAVHTVALWLWSSWPNIGWAISQEREREGGPPLHRNDNDTCHPHSLIFLPTSALFILVCFPFKYSIYSFLIFLILLGSISPPWKFLACPLVVLLPMISRLATSSFSQRSKLCSSSCRGITTLKRFCYSFSQQQDQRVPAASRPIASKDLPTVNCTSAHRLS